MSANRTRAVAIAAAAVLACAVATFGWIAFWKAPTMEVVVTVSTDDGEPREVYSRVVSLSRKTQEWDAVGSEIDMTPWAGRLARVDIRTSIRAARFMPLRRGYVACAATLSAGGEGRPLQFWGWENDGSEWLHFGRLGCSDVVSVGTGDAAAWLSPRGLLSHTLKVPPDAFLRLVLTPTADWDAGVATPHTAAPGEAAYPPRLEPDESEASPQPRRPDVFVYLIDAVRADHLSGYGYPRNTTPNIDRFAAGATLYENCQTAATWTRPSVATLLTGLYPFVHGAMHRTTDRLAEWPVMLPEITHEAGYQTAAIITNTAVKESFGFDQGYDLFKYRWNDSTDWVNGQVREFLAQADPCRPVFMYLHIMEPHLPYTPKPESLRAFDRGFDGTCDGSTEAVEAVGAMRPRASTDDIEHLIDLYDAEIYDADQGFANFLQLLRNGGRFDDSLIVLVADHGEAFNEHRTLLHGNTLNQEEMHVPLIIRYPGGEFGGTRVLQRVSHVDMFPTVLSVAGLSAEIGYPIPGRDLRPNASTGAHRGEVPIYAEVSKHSNDRLDLVGIIDEDGYKRVLDTSRPQGKVATKQSIGLWNTEADVGEQVDLRETDPVRAAYDEQLIARWLQEQRNWRHVLAREPAVPVEMTDELRRELRGLGYVD